MTSLYADIIGGQVARGFAEVVAGEAGERLVGGRRL